MGYFNDAAAADGLVAGGAPGMPGVDYHKKAPGQYYGPQVPPGTRTSNAPMATGVILYVPFFNERDGQAYDRIALDNGSTAQGGYKLRLGIFGDNSGQPGDLLVDAGELTLTADIARRAISIAFAPPRGWLWLAVQTDTPGLAVWQLNYDWGGNVGSGDGVVGALSGLPWGNVQSGITNWRPQAQPHQVRAYGAFPAAATPIWDPYSYTANRPAILLRAAV